MTNRDRAPWYLWPFAAIWRLIATIVGLTGRFVAMVVVGGITRLTGSGLSIVRWKPITGILPPLSHADWAAAFDQYRQSPEFREVNRAMTLAGFQRIFFWEYVHRLLGRRVGTTSTSYLRATTCLEPARSSSSSSIFAPGNRATDLERSASVSISVPPS